MHRLHSRQHGRNRRAGEFMDQFAKHGVFLGRTADDGERPDCVAAMANFGHIEHREVVCQTVISQVIPERTFRQLMIGDRAADAEIGFPTNQWSGRLLHHADGTT